MVVGPAPTKAIDRVIVLQCAARKKGPQTAPLPRGQEILSRLQRNWHGQRQDRPLVRARLQPTDARLSPTRSSPTGQVRRERMTRR